MASLAMTFISNTVMLPKLFIIMAISSPEKKKNIYIYIYINNDNKIKLNTDLTTELISKRITFF